MLNLSKIVQKNNNLAQPCTYYKPLQGYTYLNWTLWTRYYFRNIKIFHNELASYLTHAEVIRNEIIM